MAATSIKKRKLDSAPLPKRVKKSKFQRQYHSSSEDEAADEIVATDAPRSPDRHVKTQRQEANGVEGADQVKQSAPKGILRKQPDVTADEDEDEDDSSAGAQGSADEIESQSESDAESGDLSQEDGSKRRTVKRRDPSVFAHSMAAILSSKLPTSKRADPVLVRSKQPETANKEMEDGKLEAQAKRKLRDEKRQAKEKGRVRNVLIGDAGGLSNPLDDQGDSTISAADLAEQEKRLRKTAQRGVVKLFNAVRAAQVKGEEAARTLRENGVVGQQKREEKAGEMSRQSFLDMISSGKAKA